MAQAPPEGQLTDEQIEEKINLRMWDSKSPDQLTKERGRCLENDCDVRKVFLELKECTIRVNKKIAYTAETCQQEATDLIMALDQCVKDIAFSKIR